MIKKLWLRNWKAYDSLSLEFEAGTTFLIADNGIGKSSIIQALYYAMFGHQYVLGTSLPIANVIRGPEGTVAIAGCEVTLGSKSVRIERAIEKKSLSKVVTSVAVDIDGTRASDDQWQSLLRSATGVDSAQLSLLAFVHEGATISVEDAGLTTVEMLADVFGVGRLRLAAQECERFAKRLDRENDNLRKGLRDDLTRQDAINAARLEQEREEASQYLNQLTAQFEAARYRKDIHRMWVAYRSDKNSHDIWYATYSDRIATLLGETRNLIDESPEEVGLSAGDIDLERVAAILFERYEELLAERGKTEELKASSQQQIAVLSGENPICPTCRRPLSTGIAARAVAEHLAAQEGYSEQLNLNELMLARFRRLIGEMREFASAPTVDRPVRPVEPPPSPDEIAEYDDASIENRIEGARRKIDRINAELTIIRRLEDERRHNDQLSSRLLQGYRTAERSRLVASTMYTLADEICAERIGPLVAEIQKRWPTLSAGSQLHMQATGALSLEEGSYIVPYSSLSGGQRTLAQLAVRLLALQMATKCPFFVLDEPLEHLDARNRRSLATLLVHVTNQSSQLRQVLMTTYEESVTRRLTKSPGSSGGKESERESNAHVLRIAPASSRP